MPDLEKVVNGLGAAAEYFRASFDAMDGTLACEIFRSWAEAMEQAIALLKDQAETIEAYKSDLKETLDVMDEYAEKLKAQEPIVPIIGKIHNEDGSTNYYLHCPFDGTVIDVGDRFCRKCGRPVEWE